MGQRRSYILMRFLCHSIVDKLIKYYLLPVQFINQIMTIISKIFWFQILIICTYSIQQTAQEFIEPEYTQNLQQFKEKSFQIRTQKLLGCWLYIREEIIKQFIDASTQFKMSAQYLPILKSCLKEITRKDAIIKITALAQGNLHPVKNINEIFVYQKEKKSDLIEQNELSQFDKYLLGKSKYFQKQLQQMKSKGSIKNQVEQELKKRKQFFFGIIPAGAATHSILLVTLAIVMMCCCTWCKFWRVTSEQRSMRKAQKAKARQQEQNMVAKASKQSKISKHSKSSTLTRSILKKRQ